MSWSRRWAQKLNGIWYDLGERTQVENPYYYVHSNRYGDRYSWQYQYKRQLNRKELRLYGLQNG